MDKPEETTRSHQNYELLIRLDEQMKGLSRQVTDMASGLNQRVAVIENGKLSKEDFLKEIAEINKNHEDDRKRIAAAEKADSAMAVQIAEIKTQIKTWGTIISCVLVIVQIIIAVVKP